MVNASEFAKRLQKVLDYYGVSATAFSEEISFNRSTISHLLSGRNKPSLEFVMKVLQKYPEVELYWLLNGKGEFPAKHVNEPDPIQISDKIIPDTISTDSAQKSTLQLDTEVDKIVVFYKNGSFKLYENR